ncbi:MAG: hypothetical protein HY718_04250, partial [Planctomycetes bacterium]|nr:hypothetical protein [Planctomycetota bacterium]
PAEGVTVKPGYATDIAPGGLIILQCELTAPEQPGPFTRTLNLETDDPRNLGAAVALAGNAEH